MIRTLRRPALFLGWLMLAAFLLTGCSALAPRPSPQEVALRAEAEQLLQQIASRNPGLDSFKGVGTIRLEQPRQTPISGRLAWVARKPSKVRFVFLASGRPVLVFAADGRHVYLVDPRTPEKTYTKVRSSAGRLDRLVSMPLRTADLIALLAGRTPVLDHSEVVLQTDPELGTRVLVLRKWWSAVEKIHLDRKKDSVKRVDFLERGGGLRYRVEFLQEQTVQEFAVPKRLKISDDKGAALTLTLDRYQIADIPEESVFRIAPPDDL